MQGQPDFELRPRIAVPMTDVGEAIIARRRVPCICPEQDHRACGRRVSFSTSRGQVIEQVACDTCLRTWTRVNC